MKTDKQLDQWLIGNPVHNKEDDECCPDFSCCNGNIAPKDVRERFVKAFNDDDKKTQIEMLGMFLGQAFDKIYVAGLEIPNEEH